MGIFIFVSIVVCAFGGNDNDISWQYAPSTDCDGTNNNRCGPNEWSTLADHCAQVGTQSPTNLDLSSAIESSSSPLPNPLVGYGSCVAATFTVSPNTNKVEVCEDQNKMYVDFPTSVSGSTEEDSQLKRFYLKQWHYHSPSENTIDGKYFPMEVHHVHVADDGQALVIAVMIAVGDTPSDSGAAMFQDRVQDNMPNSSVGTDNLHKEKINTTLGFDVYDQFINLKNGYYYFSGSFTTPPCTNGTHWVMVKNPVEIKEETLHKYRKTINDNYDNQLATFDTITSGGATPAWHDDAGTFSWDDADGCNNRPIQSFTGTDNPDRKLYEVSPPGYACSEVKAAYKESKCCGNPTGIFKMPARRLSSADVGAVIDAALDGSMKDGGLAKTKQVARMINEKVRHLL